MDAKFPRICQLQSDSEIGIDVLKPYIRTELGPQRIPQCALVDTGADLNSMSYETWVALGKPKLCASSTRIATYARDYDQVEGILILPIFINDTNLAHKFYVMKPKCMVSSIILGQPWQRQFNCRVNWKKEGILYDIEEQELFEPFLGEESYAYSDFDESDDKETSQHGLKKQQDKGKSKIGDTSEKAPANSMQQHDICKAGSKKTHRATYKPAKKPRNHSLSITILW